MKRLIIALALLACMGADVSAQGFLNKLKQKALQAAKVNSEEAEVEAQTPKVESGDASNLSIAQGSDIIPKRRTSTVTWDGVLTPSTATTAEALMNELPPLPSAEKMAKSTMEERDAYAQKIAAVVVRADQLQREQSGCSDAEMEALRQKWEGKIQNQFGLTKAELAILNDENAPESKKKPIKDKVMAKVLGGDVNTMDLEKFEKMSEQEQEAYIKAHPEFIQQMQKMAMNARNFTKQTQDMTKAFSGYEAQVGKPSMTIVPSARSMRVNCRRSTVRSVLRKIPIRLMPFMRMQTSCSITTVWRRLRSIGHPCSDRLRV